jgi:hypothetical protein
MRVNGSLITNGTLTNNNGLNKSATELTDKATYVGLGWSFDGENEASPWVMGVDGYPLPVFYWQTSAPTADVSHLN